MRTDEELNELLRRQSLIVADLGSQLDTLRERHAKLVEAVMTLKVWVDLPHFDQCSPEMLKAWDLFRHIESEVGDE